MTVVSPNGRTLAEAGAQSIGRRGTIGQGGAGGVFDGGAGRSGRLDRHVGRYRDIQQPDDVQRERARTAPRQRQPDVVRGAGRHRHDLAGAADLGQRTGRAFVDRRHRHGEPGPGRRRLDQPVGGRRVRVPHRVGRQPVEARWRRIGRADRGIEVVLGRRERQRRDRRRVLDQVVRRRCRHCPACRAHDEHCDGDHQHCPRDPSTTLSLAPDSQPRSFGAVLHDRVDDACPRQALIQFAIPAPGRTSTRQQRGLAEPALEHRIRNGRRRGLGAA